MICLFFHSQVYSVVNNEFHTNNSNNFLLHSTHLPNRNLSTRLKTHLLMLIWWLYSTTVKVITILNVCFYYFCFTAAHEHCAQFDVIDDTFGMCVCSFQYSERCSVTTWQKLNKKHHESDTNQGQDIDKD